jgi:uncharacterized protein YggU (UPF0235/DUF167 family)
MTDGARAFVNVRVIPRASRTALTRDATGALRAHLTAAPVDGAANRALIALLAARLGVPKRMIELSRGECGRDKVVCVHGLSLAEIEAILVGGGSGVDKAGGRG